MATFQLDDREIPFQPGETIIEAASKVGVEIPHYCWHPGLSIAANCRMCLVEVGPPPGRPAMMLPVLRWDPETKSYVTEQKPKLMPACQTRAADGMQVKSDTSDHVRRARSAVQELLLLNHPVDCPICDQAGECRLQDYWAEHQGTAKRMTDEPVHKPKAVRFGPTIVYDAERCIVCTRCVRFCDEVAKDPVLEVRQRGNLNEISVAPGRELDHGYTLMTEHVCPVGALTSSDFRFKARVWFLRSVRSVCQGCATGCNAHLDYDPRDGKLYRYRPRENAEVNTFWMCDEGMLSYARNGENRIAEARVKGRPSSLGDAVDAAAQALQSTDGLAGLLSAEHSSEDNFALFELGRRLGVTRWFVTGRPQGDADHLLRHADKNPNREGVNAVAGRNNGTLSELAQAIEAGQVTRLVGLGSHVDDAGAAASLKKLKSFVLLGCHEGALASAATVLFPATSWAEAPGTFVNAKGLRQHAEAAVPPVGQARPAWKALAAIGRVLGHRLTWSKVDEVRADMEPAAAVEAGVSA